MGLANTISNISIYYLIYLLVFILISISLLIESLFFLLFSKSKLILLTSFTISLTPSICNTSTMLPFFIFTLSFEIALHSSPFNLRDEGCL